MSKASKIINIFILIVAIVAVVFGTLLFQKRAQLTQARSDIANTVEKVSRQIDPSATIRSDELKINKTPAEVKEAMVKLESAVDKIVKQRNAIAANLTDVTNTVLEKAYYADGDDPGGARAVGRGDGGGRLRPRLESRHTARGGGV